VKPTVPDFYKRLGTVGFYLGEMKWDETIVARGVVMEGLLMMKRVNVKEQGRIRK